MPKDIRLLKSKIFAILTKKKLLKKTNRHQITRQSYKILFDLLDQAGFFNFHITNSGKSCLVYQIIKFFLRRNGGWELMRNGIVCQMGQMEIHHINHNPDDNSEGNLIYVSPELNKLASEWTYKAVRCFAISEKKLNKLIKKLGKKIKDMQFENDGYTVNYYNLIKTTILATISEIKNKPTEDIIQKFQKSFSAKEMLRNIKNTGELYKDKVFRRGAIV
jgi:hypothetical protein